jgi:hypothetical protein
MKILTLTLAVAATIGLATGQALASSHHKSGSSLTIVMHDPGCHWFQVGGKFSTTASVAGPVKLSNFDENTLKVSNGQRIPVGKSIVLGAGRYTITMVGQAPDDNHLKLTVS